MGNGTAIQKCFSWTGFQFFLSLRYFLSGISESNNTCIGVYLTSENQSTRLNINNGWGMQYWWASCNLPHQTPVLVLKWCHREVYYQPNKVILFFYFSPAFSVVWCEDLLSAHGIRHFQWEGRRQFYSLSWQGPSYLPLTFHTNYTKIKVQN